MDVRQAVVRRPVADLTRITRPEEVDLLSLEAHVDGWNGLEHMRGLSQLYAFEGAAADDIPRLARLPELRHLEIRKATLDTAALRTLESLHQLKTLRVRVVGDRSAETLATADLSHLQRLTSLWLQLDGSRMFAPAFRGLGEVTRLQTLSIRGIEPTPGLVGELARLRNLTDFDYSVEPGGNPQPIAAALPGVRTPDFEWEPYAEELPRELIYIDEMPDDQRDPADDLRWDLTIDLVTLWDVETQYEGEAQLRQLIERRLPHLEAELLFDTEADEVWIRCARREPLEKIRDLVLQVSEQT